MKQLQIFNIVLLAAGITMGVILAVMLLIYSFYLDSEPRLRSDMPALLVLTLCFSALALAGGLSFLGHQRQWPARWLTQAAPALPLAGIVLYLASLKT